MIPDLFGGELKPDPIVALQPYAVPEELSKTGSLHKLHYVVEIVGQRTLPSSQTKPLLEDRWQLPLGRPKVYVMSAADSGWRALEAGDTATAYDSLALAWPYLTGQGNLSMGSAHQLLVASEHYAAQVGRKAMPLPTPEDVDEVVRMLVQIRDNLDVGVTVLVIPNGTSISERDVWLGCASLGLEYVSPGVFQWLAQPGGVVMLEVAPFEDAGWFARSSVEAGRTLGGFSIGFSIPRSPDPVRSADAALRVGMLFNTRFNCVAFDDSHRPIGPSESTEILAVVAQGRDALVSAGIRPGSQEAHILFGR
ncbi:MAG: cell division protein ZipA C-terminal FtsZ-binding domain-containing protein [Fimbriimonadaceae bacterium]